MFKQKLKLPYLESTGKGGIPHRVQAAEIWRVEEGKRREKRWGEDTPPGPADCPPVRGVYQPKDRRGAGGSGAGTGFTHSSHVIGRTAWGLSDSSAAPTPITGT